MDDETLKQKQDQIIDRLIELGGERHRVIHEFLEANPSVRRSLGDIQTHATKILNDEHSAGVIEHVDKFHDDINRTVATLDGMIESAREAQKPQEDRRPQFPERPNRNRPDIPDLPRRNNPRDRQPSRNPFEEQQEQRERERRERAQATERGASALKASLLAVQNMANTEHEFQDITKFKPETPLEVQELAIRTLDHIEKDTLAPPGRGLPGEFPRRNPGERGLDPREDRRPGGGHREDPTRELRESLRSVREAAKAMVTVDEQNPEGQLNPEQVRAFHESVRDAIRHSQILSNREPDLKEKANSIRQDLERMRSRANGVEGTRISMADPVQDMVLAVADVGEEHSGPGSIPGGVGGRFIS